MGEIADDHVDRMLEDGYGFGVRLLSRRWNRPRDWQEQPTTCTKCGVENLLWTETAAGWRLYESGNLHKCKPEAVHAQIADDFDVVE